MTLAQDQAYLDALLASRVRIASAGTASVPQPGGTSMMFHSLAALTAEIERVEHRIRTGSSTPAVREVAFGSGTIPGGGHAGAGPRYGYGERC